MIMINNFAMSINILGVIVNMAVQYVLVGVFNTCVVRVGREHYSLVPDCLNFVIFVKESSDSTGSAIGKLALVDR